MSEQDAQRLGSLLGSDIGTENVLDTTMNNESTDGVGGTEDVDDVAPSVAGLEDTSETIHDGSQGKHEPGHNNFIPGRSEISEDVDPQGLLDGVHSGEYPVVDVSGRGDPIVDFGRPIGIDASSGEETQYGTIHSGRNGAHIVPTNPNTVDLQDE